MVEKRKAHNIALTLEVKEKLKEINANSFEPMGISLSYNQIIKHLLAVYAKTNELPPHVEEETAVLEQRSDDKPFEESYDETA